MENLKIQYKEALLKYKTISKCVDLLQMEQSKSRSESEKVGSLLVVKALGGNTTHDIPRLEIGSWCCEDKDNPIGICCYDCADDPAMDSCLFCGEPDERK